MKRFFKSLFLLLLLLFLLRGWFFRKTVSYHLTGSKETHALTEAGYRHFIDNQPVDTSIDKIIRQALRLTTDRLRFTTGKNDIDPNQLFHSKNAHCVGYAAFFATTCNELFRKSGLDGRFEVKHLRGKISFLGLDLHQFFDGPFFRDHDFNVILDKTTGKRYYVDASVRDVLGIVYVRGE